jgi:hypothetical protein
MIQIYINNKELDLPADIINQIGINYQNFSIGDFLDKFNSFSGNLTFPNTPKNALIFGLATDNLNPTNIHREFTGKIVNGAIEVFYGRVNYERFNKGFECRFFTTGQTLVQKLGTLQMWDVLDSLPETTDWFNHKFQLTNFPTYGVGRFSGKTNVVYPNIDLGYFNRNDGKLGFWDYRPTFSLYTLIDAIAYKLGYTFNFNGTVPQTLKDCYIASNNFEYSKRLIDKNTTEITLSSAPQTSSGVSLPSLGVRTSTNILFPFVSKVGIWNSNIFIDTTPPATTQIFERSPYQLNANFETCFAFYLKVQNLQFINDIPRGYQYVLFELNLNFKNSSLDSFELSFSPDYSSQFPPVVTEVSDYKVSLQLFANTDSSDVYATMYVRLKSKKLVNADGYLNFSLNGINYGANYPYGYGSTPQGLVNITTDFYSLPNEPLVKLVHDPYIYPNGLISATDLLGSLKPADVLKYAMRLSGTYLTETDNSFTLNRFDNYQVSTAKDWSGKLNTLNGITVDYLNNDLGKNNWLVYKQDSNNTNLSPYAFGGNLPTNIGDQLNIMYESIFAQSAQNQTCSGRVVMIRIPYFNADIQKVYKVWQNAAVTYLVNEYVGYNGLLFKVIDTVLGNAGTPPSLPAKYEALTYSEFQPQSVEFRAMSVNLEWNPTLGFTQVVAVDGGIALTNDITASLEPLSFQTAIDNFYNFIPDTFLDWRQIEVELMLTSIDIATLDLSKLVRIDELNGTFYINTISNYTPDISVPTKVILTLLS